MPIAMTVATAILGITLGQPLSLPKCVFGNDASYLDPTQSCVSPVSGVVGLYDLNLSDKDRPSFLTSTGQALRVRDGNVVQVQLETDGPDVQNAAFQALMIKYGRPSTKSSAMLQNRFGAKYRGLYATWRRKDAIIEFTGVEDADSGEINVMTPEFSEGRKAEGPTGKL